MDATQSGTQTIEVQFSALYEKQYLLRKEIVEIEKEIEDLGTYWDSHLFTDENARFLSGKMHPLHLALEAKTLSLGRLIRMVEAVKDIKLYISHVTLCGDYDGTVVCRHVLTSEEKEKVNAFFPSFTITYC